MLLNLFYVFVAVAFLVFRLFNGAKGLRYRNWYRPWLVLLLALIAPVFKDDIDGFVSTFFPLINYGFEVVFCIAFLLVWLFIKFLLNRFKIDDILESILKKHNSNKLKQQQVGFANYLVWPYYIQGFSVFKRPGFKLYKYLVFSVLFFTLFTYLFTIIFIDDLEETIPTALGLLSIPIFIEWLIYFSATVKEDEKDIKSKGEEINSANFYNLFKRYVNKEHGFYDSILFGYFKNQKNIWEKELKNNNTYIKDTIQKSINKNTDFIVSSNDITDTLPDFSELFFDTLNKGGNILLLADIPDHTTYKVSDIGLSYPNQDSLMSISELFSLYLQETFEHKIPNAKNLIDIGFYSKQDKTGLRKRILLTNLKNALDEELIHNDWIRELDLVIVLKFNDAYADNLLIQRKFSLWLHQQNIKYKTVLFKTFRTSGDEAFTNTWVTVKNPEETKLKNISKATRNYFINFAFEKSELNLKQIFKGNSYQFDFSPGIELSLFPVMENVNNIHFFEGYNLDYVQSKNKIVTSHSIFQENTLEKYNYYNGVSQNNLNKAIQVHNLPFIVSPFEKEDDNKKHLSVIYDIENNAPKLYKKYSHLGLEESFLCLISKPHLFRDFFAEQISYFTDNTLEALAPQLSKAKINLCLQLFHLLMHEELSVSFVQHLLNQYNIELKDVSVVDFLADLFNVYLHLDIKENAILKYRKTCIFKGGKYQTDQRLTIDKQALETNDVFDYLDEVKLVDNSQNTLLVVPKYLLFQNILPQQNIIINGSSYEYANFNPLTNELVLNATKTDSQVFYRPLAVINHFEKPNEVIDVENNCTFYVQGKPYQFQLSLLETQMRVSYKSYYKFEKYYHSPYADVNTPISVALSDDFLTKSIRKYQTRYLKLHWEISDNSLKNKSLIVTQLHHLLYEFLPILFPYRHQYIQILSNNEYSKEHRQLTPWVFAEHNFKFDNNNAIQIYLVEDSFSDLGVLKSIQLHFEYILKHLYDLLLWINDDKEYFSTDYTEFVKGGAFTKDKLQFLKYGLKENNWWNVEILLKFIYENAFFDNDTLNDNHLKRSGNENLYIDVECDYCKSSYTFKEIEVMEDGLHRCSNCSVDAVDEDEQLKELETEAKALYKKYLNIDFYNNSLTYKLNFVTATYLHTYFNKPFYVTNKYDERTVVGIASDRELDVIHIEKHLQKPQTISILIHEMMHIYQFQHLNFFKIKEKEPKLIEGMTTWAEYLLLSKSGITAYEQYAKQVDLSFTKDQTEYGIGYRYVKEKYGESMIKAIEKKYRIR